MNPTGELCSDVLDESRLGASLDMRRKKRKRTRKERRGARVRVLTPPINFFLFDFLFCFFLGPCVRWIHLLLGESIPSLRESRWYIAGWRFKSQPRVMMRLGSCDMCETGEHLG